MVEVLIHYRRRCVQLQGKKETLELPLLLRGQQGTKRLCASRSDG